LPQLVAIIYAMNYAEEHNIIQEYPYLPIPSSVVYVNQSVDLRKLAKELNVCYDDLLEMNAELRHGIIPSTARNYPLRIPSERLLDYLNRQDEMLAAVKFTGEEYKPMVKNHGNYLYHVVNKGETLSGIAQKYGVRLSALKEWNNMTSNFLRTGQKLMVYSPLAAPKKEVPVMTKTQAKPLLPQRVSETTPQATYVVKDGDTLWGIAQKFEGLTVQRIKKLNQLRSNRLTPGQKLRVK
ncbi:MAG: LysM peptidoglycan-binding domain-containing protein, partial [Flammeovirgaceae bacterium]|nr:LysM peptidoglycan-binding domain-containing protein [Flammeovirgaceae bacterium]